MTMHADELSEHLEIERQRVEQLQSAARRSAHPHVLTGGVVGAIDCCDATAIALEQERDALKVAASTVTLLLNKGGEPLSLYASREAALAKAAAYNADPDADAPYSCETWRVS
jgi:hypothetical protein